jgi:predicted anti-sigma-YlaC factor YlaD
MKKKMVCDDFKALLSRCQDKELDPVREAALEAHLKGCESCSREWLQLNRLTGRIKQLPEIDTGPYFTQRVMGRILEKEQVPSLSASLVRWIYSMVFLAFLVLGVLANSGLSLFHLQDRPGQNQSQEEMLVTLLVESQDLSLLNVQDTTVALLEKGNGENNEL